MRDEAFTEANAELSEKLAAARSERKEAIAQAFVGTPAARRTAPSVMAEIAERAVCEWESRRAPIERPDLDGLAIVAANVRRGWDGAADDLADEVPVLVAYCRRLEDDLRIANERGDGWRDTYHDDTKRIEELTDYVATLEAEIADWVKTFGVRP